jgi:hypothetical protein
MLPEAGSMHTRIAGLGRLLKQKGMKKRREQKRAGEKKRRREEENEEKYKMNSISKL